MFDWFSFLDEFLEDMYDVKVTTPATGSELYIKSNGKKTTAVLKENGKFVGKGVATCNDTDEFDFTTGANLAIARIKDKNATLDSIASPAKKKYLTAGGSSRYYGVLGTSTSLKDDEGNALCVGDTISVYDPLYNKIRLGTVIIEPDSGKAEAFEVPSHELKGCSIHRVKTFEEANKVGFTSSYLGVIEK